MCDPTVTAATFGGLQVYSGMQRADAQRRAGREQAAILSENADLSERAAGDALQRGGQAEARAVLAGGLRQGAERAQLAASGGDVQAGSALDTLADQSMMTALDAAILRNNASREAGGLRARARMQRRQAGYALEAADDAADASILGGITGAASLGLGALRVS